MKFHWAKSSSKGSSSDVLYVFRKPSHDIDNHKQKSLRYSLNSELKAKQAHLSVINLFQIINPERLPDSRTLEFIGNLCKKPSNGGFLPVARGLRVLCLAALYSPGLQTLWLVALSAETSGFTELFRSTMTELVPLWVLDFWLICHYYIFSIWNAMCIRH